MIEAKICGIEVGDNFPVAVIGAINVSPDSFYKGSIKLTREEIAFQAEKMVGEGAAAIDLGAVSTAPYRKFEEIPVAVEKERLVNAIKTVKAVVDVPVSADTRLSEVAEAALNVGADIINDVSGFKWDGRMADIVAEYGAVAYLAACERKPGEGGPVGRILAALKESLEIAQVKGVALEKLVVDPAIGFLRPPDYPWYLWDCYVLGNLFRLRSLGRPILVAVSRKSFIGKILGQEHPEQRLYGSLASEAVAVYNGAHMIRTHDVAATVEAVRMAESMRRKVSLKASGRIEVETVAGAGFKDDMAEEIRKLGAAGAEALSQKAVFRAIKVKNLPTPLALLVKQEMLAVGGDAALPESALVFGEKAVDVLLLGTLAQYNGFMEKIKRAPFEGWRLAEVLRELLKLEEEHTLLGTQAEGSASP
ncbi:dihydropteroate synthase [Candidatus Hecatella orcuttiae]|jgi:dihydropteroate synthase|uniref:dihydropteroate synthase n=1 Tax=Candidatus Hecatella orcuttiae TaxID=1935119 RepID=UPI00286801C0|nr:dihydropteroate synthase [Candidatus Hecatella orcuttiae]